VVIGAAESLDDDDVEVSDEDDEDVVGVGVAVAVALAELTWAVAVDAGAPMAPSKETTPQARTKPASVPATTRWRISRMRRARAASRSWARATRSGEGMQSTSDPPPRADCEDPERMLGDDDGDL
jgi:hypothetical protein